MFQTARLKIEWANHHIAHLNSILRTFAQTDFCKFAVERETNTGQYLLTFTYTAPLPLQIPLVIGDALHNLRSALDHVACAIVTLAGETPSRETYFPIHETRSEVIGAVEHGQIQLAGSDIVQLIVDGIQPHDGGKGAALWALHRLDITDKHRLLITVYRVVAIPDFVAEDESRNSIEGITVSGEGTFRILSTSAELHIKNHGHPIPDIFFGQGEEIVGGERVIPRLNQLSQVVAGVVDTLEQAYLTRG